MKSIIQGTPCSRQEVDFLIAWHKSILHLVEHNTKEEIIKHSKDRIQYLENKFKT